MENIQPIIFLDLDGVLNHEAFYTSDEYNELISDENNYANGENYFCKETVEKLNKVTDSTGAKIVFSSSHRVDFDTLFEMQNYLKHNGITGDVISRTPKLYFENYDSSVPRGCEILAWLNNKKNILGTSIGKYKKYIIFDDDKDMLYYQRNNFIHVDSFIGITDENVKEAIKILKHGW